MKPTLFSTVTTYVVRKEDGDWSAPRVARADLKAFGVANAKQRARLAVRLRLLNSQTISCGDDLLITMVSAEHAESVVKAGV